MIAVLTGDLVNSTKMTDDIYSGVIKDLTNILLDCHTKYGATGDIYRGDEFQIQFPNPLFAIEATLLIKLSLQLSKLTDKPIQCTFSLAYGNYDTLDKKPNTSSGPVFIESGRGLEKTPRGDISIHFVDTEVKTTANNELNLLTQFLNHLLNRLTRTQASLLYQYIETQFAEHKKLADAIGTSRQNISNRLSNIGAFLVRDYIAMVNNIVTAKQGQQ